MLKVLSQLGGTSHHFPLSDPLLQLIHLAVELVEPVLLLQAALALLHQVLQRNVQAVHLRLTLTDLLTVPETEYKRACFVIDVRKSFSLFVPKGLVDPLGVGSKCL